MRKQLTNSTWLRKKKLTLNLSNIQKAVLIGTLLGDGYLRLSRSGRAARLQVCHAQSAKEYLFWLQDIFSDFVFAKPDYQIANHALRFTTVSHSDFLTYYNSFYRTGIKKVPDNINDLLSDPLSLAIWFMDDGNGYLKSSAYRISTYAFGLEGNQILASCLKNNFDLKVNLVKDSKGYQLYIPIKGDNASRFHNLVDPFIIPSMRYKLEHRSPVETHIVGTG
ncbi:MAG: hypothetical protein ABII21_01220 [bacterium]